MTPYSQRRPPILHWKIGRWIPPEQVEECDQRIHAYRDKGAEEDLVAAWAVLEPWTRSIAEELWWRAAWRIGTVVEPADLVSLAKSVFLERLITRWDSFRGAFMVYALVSFRIEFVKHNWKLMRRKPRFADPEELVKVAEPVTAKLAELQIDIDVALNDLAKRNPARADQARWALEHLTVPLRDLARIHVGQKGFSRGSLHLRRKAMIAYLARRLKIN